MFDQSEAQYRCKIPRNVYAGQSLQDYLSIFYVKIVVNIVKRTIATMNYEVSLATSE